MASLTPPLAQNAQLRPVLLAHALSPNQNAGLIALHFVIMYLELSIYSGDSIIFPYFGATAFAIVGASLNRSAIKPQHLSMLVAVILAILLAGIGAATGGNVDLLEFLRSYFQLIAALVSGYCIFIIGILSSRDRLIKLLSAILIVIIVGSFLERFPIIRAVSDTVRLLLYPEKLLYNADYRDLVSYGAIRPRFFAREPSVVGIGAGLLITMIFLLIRARPMVKTLGALAVALVCIVIMRSPTIIVFVAIVGFGALALQPTATARFTWILGICLAIMLIGVSFLLLYGSGLSGIENRAILGGGSYVLRIFGPPLIWLETLRSDALFGLGLGSFDALWPMARRAYSAYEILALFPHLRAERDGAFLLSNGFWEYWIFFGLAGGTLIIALLFRLFRALGLLYASFPFFATMLALQNFGGISAYRPWHMLFIFAAIAFIIHRNDEAVRNHRAILAQDNGTISSQ